MNCKLYANYLKLVFELCAISEQIVCKLRHTDKNTYCCTSRVAFMAKTDCTSVYKSVSCTIVHKTGLLYKSTQNKFMVQVYTKPVYCTSRHKISSLCNFKECTGTEHYQGLRNVQGQNITMALCTLLISKLVLYTLVL